MFQTPDGKRRKIQEGIYCPDCEMLLNGPTQWEDHKIGKKHKKNEKKAKKKKAEPEEAVSLWGL